MHKKVTKLNFYLKKDNAYLNGANFPYGTLTLNLDLYFATKLLVQIINFLL